MFMPNDDSTPQMFEKRNGLSSVATARLQIATLTLQRKVHFVRLDVAREPDVPIDGLARKDLQVSLRQSLEESRDLAGGRHRRAGSRAAR